MGALARIRDELIELPQATEEAPDSSRVIELRSLVQVLSDLAEDCSEAGCPEAAQLIRRYARTPEAGLTWTRSPREGEAAMATLDRVIKQVTGPAPWLRRARRLMLEDRYP